MTQPSCIGHWVHVQWCGECTPLWLSSRALVSPPFVDVLPSLAWQALWNPSLPLQRSEESTAPSDHMYTQSRWISVTGAFLCALGFLIGCDMHLCKPCVYSCCRLEFVFLPAELFSELRDITNILSHSPLAVSSHPSSFYMQFRHHEISRFPVSTTQ